MGTGTGRLNCAGRIDHGGTWRDETDYPLPDTRLMPFYLQPEGGLATQPPPAGAPASTYTFDPADPVPTLGGGISAGEPVMRAGAYDQRGRAGQFGCRDQLPLNARSDVLTFQTPPLTEELEVTGPIRVRLYAASSARDTDFTAKLLDVFPPGSDHPDGLAMNLTDSIIRARYRNGWEHPELLEPHRPYAFEFELYPTSNRFRVGHRVRVDVSSSNFPRFDVNPNTGGRLGLDRRIVIAEQTIYHDAEHPSQIILPIIARRPGRAGPAHDAQ
jgi:putative CocE/NonD family hydrolase